VRPLIRFALGQSALMNMVFIGTLVFGLCYAVWKLPVDRFPNFSFGEVGMHVRWAGASPQDIERQVVKPLEDALRGMNQLEFIRATSMQGLANFHIKFEDDSDYEDLYREFRLRILSAQNRLPQVNGKPLAPEFVEIEVDQWLPTVQINLYAGDPAKSLGRRAMTLAAKELQSRLEKLPGVKRIDLLGDEYQQYIIALDPRRLRQTNLSVEEIAQALMSAGITMPAGRAETGNEERFLRIDGSFRTPEEVEGVVVRREGDGRLLRLGEIIDRSQTGIRRLDNIVSVTTNGRDAVAVKVLKEARSDARDVKVVVVAETEAFLKDHGASGLAYILTQDSTIAVQNSMDSLTGNVMQGAALALAVLTLFLGFRSAIISISGMAMAIVGSLVWFYFMGRSLNELSLLGFILVVGVLVDDSVVIFDNVQRLREEGRPLREAIIDGVAEVFWPIASSAATNIAGFLPLFLMTGMVGEFFSLIPEAVVVVLIIDVLECILLIPLHILDAEHLLGRPRRRFLDYGVVPSAALRPGFALFRPFLALSELCLRVPWLSLGLVGVLFIGALGVLVQSATARDYGMKPLLHLEFFPSEAAVMQISVALPPGTNLDATDRTVREISAWLAEQGPSHIASTTGLAGMDLDVTFKPVFGSRFALILAEIPAANVRAYDDPNRYIRETADTLVARFQNGPDGRPKPGWTIKAMAQSGGPPVGRPLSVRLSGRDDAQVRRVAARLSDWLRTSSASGGDLAGITAIENDGESMDTITAFIPMRDRMAQYGVSELAVQRLASSLFDGLYVGDFRRSDDEVPLRLRMAASNDAQGLRALAEVPLGPGAGNLRWTDIARISHQREPAQLIRRNFIRTLTVSADLLPDSGLNAFSATDTVRTWWATERFREPGVTLQFGGEAESTARSYASLGIAFLIAFFVIFALLAAQFGSYLQPLIIMTNIFFSFTGVVLVMGLFGAAALMLGPTVVRPERATFTVTTFIAIIALTGMVVNNAILLVEVINTRRAAGVPLDWALREAVGLRLRPILLTTLTTLMGLLPTAIGFPSYNPTWTPMCMAFFAGLLVSTVLTMMVVPILYGMVERYRIIGWAMLTVMGGGWLAAFIFVGGAFG
jgi:HAE1 family hydrophobic/amphiphilic exporter-1